MTPEAINTEAKALIARIDAIPHSPSEAVRAEVDRLAAEKKL